MISATGAFGATGTLPQWGEFDNGQYTKRW